MSRSANYIERTSVFSCHLNALFGCSSLVRPMTDYLDFSIGHVIQLLDIVGEIYII